MKIKVIDASVLLHSSVFQKGAFYLTPNSVFNEVLNEEARLFAGQALKNDILKIADPNELFVKKTKGKAVETGDIGVLSPADIELMALALENNAVVVSDDYAIQNTAKALGLEVEPVMQDGIKKTVKWQMVCEGCNKIYDASKKGLCPVCGSRILKKPST